MNKEATMDKDELLEALLAAGERFDEGEEGAREEYEALAEKYAALVRGGK